MHTKLGKAFFTIFAATLIAAAFTQSAFASKAQLSVIEDPARVLSSDPSQRATSLDETVALGADVAKIAVTWRSYAPDSGSAIKPGGDLTDPASYPAGVWDILDDAVSGAQSRNLKVWLMITAPAPRWAVSQEEGGKYIGNYLPSADDYSDFVKAVGRRYPSVHIFSFWNEPNLKRFLEPQTKSGIAVAAQHYRDLYRAGYSAIRSAGHTGDTLLFGELVGRRSNKFDTNTTPPVAFLREFFCLDTKGKALKGSTAKKHGCSSFKKLTASGIAYHPYRLSGGPLDADKVSKDNAPINYLKRIENVLDQAYKAKRISKSKLPIYNSEFGFQSDPPDEDAGTPISRIPAYLNYSEYLSWLDPRVSTYSQYEIVDDGDLAGFQTGLRFVDGTLKSGVYAAYQTPMVVMTTKSNNRVSVWGGVRKKASSSVTIEVQYKNGSSWKTARTIRTSAKHGYFLTTVAVTGAKSKTWQIVSGDLASRSAKAVTPPRPRS
ncbi:MAG: hypothetical protein QM648_00985 [Solirubrobacterales bacterium]